MSKSVPLSVRMTGEDIAMLAELDIGEAVTPSDKIRALVRAAHRQKQGRRDPDEAIRLEEERFAPVLHQVRAREARHRIHSEFLLRVLTWLPDANALAVSSLSDEADASNDVADLEALEEALGEKVFTLALAVLNGCLAPQANWYRGRPSSVRLSAIIEVVRALDRMAPARGE
jgi:hypothetical protein